MAAAASVRHQLPSRIVPLFDALRIPTTAYSASAAAGFALRPLLAPSAAEFCFERYQYVALGDAVIERAVAAQVSAYFLRRCATNGDGGGLGPFVASPNSARQMAACFHNALSVRFVAESLPLAAIAGSTDARAADGSAASTDLDPLDIFASAAPRRIGPNATRDRRGTSFDWAPHSFAHADVGPRLSHFFGCLELFASREVALQAARLAFFDLDGERGNVPYEAARVLATLCGKYPPANVARALLAAQGLRGVFLSRSIGGSSSGSGSGRASSNASDKKSGASAPVDEAHSSGAVSSEATSAIVSPASTAGAGVVGARVGGAAPGSAVPPDSHAVGPGRIDLVGKWLRAVSTDSENNKLLPQAEFGGSGWVRDKSAAAADASSSSSSTSVPPPPSAFVRATLADAAGMPGTLVSGQFVTQRLHSTPVRDPSFFDAAANRGKDGVPMESLPVVVAGGAASRGAVALHGSGASGGGATGARDVVRLLTQPHSRLFEVSLVRDPLVSSSTLRRETYKSALATGGGSGGALGDDSGSGRSMADFTRESMFDGATAAAAAAAFRAGDDQIAVAPTVGPRVLARGVGDSLAQARRSAALSFLETVVADLSSF